METNKMPDSKVGAEMKAQVPEPVGAVRQAGSRIHGSIESLREAVDNLEKMMRPLLISEPETDKESQKDEKPAECELASDLRIAEFALREEVSRINSVIRRCQI
jgi:hypothetical protein